MKTGFHRTKPKGLGESASQRPSEDQERTLAETIGGVRVAGSGSSHYSKGDARCRKFRAEAKTTEASSIRLEGKWLAKIWREATEDGKEPCLEVEIRGLTGPAPNKWVAIPSSLFSEMLDQLGWKGL